MATGDKKRAVMTDDINNSGSAYPVLGPTGDGSNVTAAFTAAGSRTNISTGEKLSVIFGKVAKWFSDLGAAAFRAVDATPTAGSTNLVESGGVKSALDKVAVRPNLLDNWYFVGGGSQQGGGQFPINQRGQTVYSTSDYTVDKWTISGATSTLTADNLQIIRKSGLTARGFIQTINPSLVSSLVGKTVTVSSKASGYNRIIMRCDNSNIIDTGADDADKPFVYKSGVVPAGTTSISVALAFPSSDACLLEAAKFEIGDSQTLCHNEGTKANPVWVLNEVPDYATELLKCQTRYQLFRTESLRPTYRQDFRPVMDASSGADPDIPNTGTITIGGVTYYYASSD